MQIGFKTGPLNWEEGKRIVEEDGARLCEMWFRIERAGEYDDKFSWLEKQGVKTGLHHWGLAGGKYKTNLGTSNTAIRQETIQQIKDTIDVGAQISCAYVNAHPGAAQDEELDLERGRQQPVPSMLTDPEESAALFLAAAQELEAYAKEKNVLLTLETLPGREQYVLGDRSRLYNPQSLPLAVMGKLGAQGNWLANDITHTLSSIAAAIHDDGEQWNVFMTFARQTASFTRLIHANTLMPPHDGTDSHDGVREEDFAKGVVPSRERMLEFLSLFQARDDVFVVPEPRENMQQNVRALQELVKSI